MSLPKTLQVAKERLDTAKGLMNLHSEQVVTALTSETGYRGDYEEELIRQTVKASQQATNARTQFFNYEKEFEDFLNNQKSGHEVREEYDIPVNLEEYKKAYESAENMALRHDRLKDQIKGLSKVMENNDMGNPWEQLKQEHPWYEEPEESQGFQPATNM